MYRLVLAVLAFGVAVGVTMGANVWYLIALYWLIVGGHWIKERIIAR